VRREGLEDPLAQLGCGFSGERQPKDARWLDQPVGHQPHHPGGHRFGFTRAGARDDDQRAGRRGDDGALLGSRREKPQLAS